jgi:hypothetical protein
MPSVGQLIWPSISYAVPALLFASGAILFAVSTILVQARSIDAKDAASATWLAAAGIDAPESCDAAARIELVERLALVGAPWCAEVLRAAWREERTPSVRKAIRKALRAIRGS